MHIYQNTFWLTFERSDINTGKNSTPILFFKIICTYAAQKTKTKIATLVSLHLTVVEQFVLATLFFSSKKRKTALCLFRTKCTDWVVGFRRFCLLFGATDFGASAAAASKHAFKARLPPPVTQLCSTILGTRLPYSSLSEWRCCWTTVSGWPPCV